MTRRSARTTTALLLALVLLGITGCGAVDEVQNSADVTTTEMSIPEEAPTVDGGDYGVAADESLALSSSDVAVDATDRLIIRNKTMRLEVDAVEDAISAIESLAADHDAIITAMQVATDDETPVYRYYDETSYSGSDALRGYVTVRVPATEYDAFLSGVTGIGTVLYQSENADDVTQQHVDLSARLANLRAEEERLREFFDAATKVDDMLAIEQELSRVRGEIESLDAQVKYLERQAAMATVTIDLTEPQPLVSPSGDDWGFGQAITDGFRGAAAVIRVAISLLIAAAPIWVLLVAGFFIGRAIYRRHVERQAAESASQTDAQ